MMGKKRTKYNTANNITKCDYQISYDTGTKGSPDEKFDTKSSMNWECSDGTARENRHTGIRPPGKRSGSILSIPGMLAPHETVGTHSAWRILLLNGLYAQICIIRVWCSPQHQENERDVTRRNVHHSIIKRTRLIAPSVVKAVVDNNLNVAAMSGTCGRTMQYGGWYMHAVRRLVYGSWLDVHTI